MGKLREHLQTKHGLRVATISLDDYYLPYAELESFLKLANSPFYKFRGNPGTHKVPLLVEHLKDLHSSNMKECIELPLYDKLARNGQGDRVGTRNIELPIDLVLIEGWMLGFSAKPDIQSSSLQVNFVNDMLRSYEEVWRLIDGWIWLKVKDIKIIYEWRWEQEVSSCRALGRACRSRGEIDNFVSQFIPTYHEYYNCPALMMWLGNPSSSIIIINVRNDRYFSRDNTK